MDVGETLYASDRAEWRGWLSENYAKSREIWLVSYSKASGKSSIAYNDAVEEALCFGWIDSTNKKIGPDSRAQRWTPRRPGSPLSEMNKVRVLRLVEAGQMTQAGLNAIGGVPDAPFVLAEDIVAELRADADTWRNFEAFPESYKRIRVGWIEGARNRPEVFKTRLRYLLRMTKQNKRFGMVQ